MKLGARSIELDATAGQAKVVAADDVIVWGEKVRFDWDRGSASRQPTEAPVWS